MSIFDTFQYVEIFFENVCRRMRMVNVHNDLCCDTIPTFWNFNLHSAQFSRGWPKLSSISYGYNQLIFCIRTSIPYNHILNSYRTTARSSHWNDEILCGSRWSLQIINLIIELQITHEFSELTSLIRVKFKRCNKKSNYFDLN